MSSIDEIWQEYKRASYVQMAAVAAMSEIPDIQDIERDFDECD